MSEGHPFKRSMLKGGANEEDFWDQVGENGVDNGNISVKLTRAKRPEE
jgi:hypothetical protein